MRHDPPGDSFNDPDTAAFLLLPYLQESFANYGEEGMEESSGYQHAVLSIPEFTLFSRQDHDKAMVPLLNDWATVPEPLYGFYLAQ